MIETHCANKEIVHVNVGVGFNYPVSSEPLQYEAIEKCFNLQVQPLTQEDIDKAKQSTQDEQSDS